MSETKPDPFWDKSLEDVNLDPSKPKGWKFWEESLEDVKLSPFPDKKKVLVDEDLIPRVKKLIDEFLTAAETSNAKEQLMPIIGEGLKKEIAITEVEINNSSYTLIRQAKDGEITGLKVFKKPKGAVEFTEDLDVIYNPSFASVEYTVNKDNSLIRLKNNLAAINKSKALLNELIAPNMQPSS